MLPMPNNINFALRCKLHADACTLPLIRLLLDAGTPVMTLVLLDAGTPAMTLVLQFSLEHLQHKAKDARAHNLHRSINTVLHN